MYVFFCLVNFGSSSTTLDGDISTDVGTTYNCTSGVSFKVGAADIRMTNLLVSAFMDDSSASPQFLKTGLYKQGVIGSIIPWYENCYC